MKWGRKLLDDAAGAVCDGVCRRLISRTVNLCGLAFHKLTVST